MLYTGALNESAEEYTRQNRGGNSHNTNNKGSERVDNGANDNDNGNNGAYREEDRNNNTGNNGSNDNGNNARHQRVVHRRNNNGNNVANQGVVQRGRNKVKDKRLLTVSQVNHDDQIEDYDMIMASHQSEIAAMRRKWVKDRQQMKIGMFIFVLCHILV